MSERFTVEPAPPRYPEGWVATAVGGHHDGECAWSGTYAECIAWVRARGGQVLSR